MSVDDPAAGLEERLRRLVELRKIEEEKYGKLLTLLDHIWRFPLPQEIRPRIPEIKDSLNHVWQFSSNDLAAAQSEDRTFWKEVAGNFLNYIEPLVLQQKNVNSLVVHLLNEHIEAVQKSLEEVQQFQNTLIHYFQAIVPVVDTKFREMAGVAENFQLGLREYSDLIFQQLDKKIQTLQTDVLELRSLEGSVRSIHQLVNARQASTTTQTGGAPAEVQPRSLAPEMPHDREEQKGRFSSFVSYFQQKQVSPVLDAACATGEFLELLKEAGIEASGVEASSEAVQICHQAGVSAVHADCERELSSRAESSIGGIFFSRGADYFLPQVLLNLLRLSYSRLKPGGLLVLHAVNVSTASGLLQKFTRYPEPGCCYHPQTLQALVSSAGFPKAEIVYADAVPATQKLRMIPNASDETQVVWNENLEKLNAVLFGPKLYAIMATK